VVALDIIGGPVHNLQQPVLPSRITKNMRRTIERRALVQRLDEGEGKSVFDLPRQPDLDLVLVPDHCRSMDHLATPRLRGGLRLNGSACQRRDDIRLRSFALILASSRYVRRPSAGDRSAALLKRQVSASGGHLCRSNRASIICVYLCREPNPLQSCFKLRIGPAPPLRQGDSLFQSSKILCLASSFLLLLPFQNVEVNNRSDVLE